jgi:hypothetical protein
MEHVAARHEGIFPGHGALVVLVGSHEGILPGHGALVVLVGSHEETLRDHAALAAEAVAIFPFHEASGVVVCGSVFAQHSEKRSC